MIRLSEMGHTIPEIARVLHQHEQTVRKYIKVFIAQGLDFEALADAPIADAPK